jgi:hypothetical protein
MQKGTGLALVLAATLAIAIGYTVGRSGDGVAVAQNVSPTGIVEDRDVYYPGTEELAPDDRV